MYDENKMVVAADVIIEHKGKILIIKRGNDPFKGMPALPGGRHEKDETIEQTAKREIKEETGLDVELTDILGVYSDKNRDPREHTLSVVFIAKPRNDNAKPSSDAAGIEWIEPEKIELDRLAFDHGKIIKDYLEWCDKKDTFWSSK
ncbi:MAG: NUDIX hydrolase [Candidatus Aenigmarchaeota archaeon]|nr:NUDIX hydrolase [Candidatus Aenigmarchaeota archaeon]